MKLEKENFDRIRIFYETFTIGSTVKAGKKLGHTPSWISRQISSLEQEVGEKLTFKVGKYLHLNPKGKEFMEMIEKIFLNYTHSLVQFKRASQAIEGKLTLSLPSFLSSVGFFDDITPFLQSHPALNLSIKTTNESPNLTTGESDIDIRPLTKKEDTIDYRYLTTYDIGLYASSTYLQKNGFLEGVSDFNNHHLIAFSKECLFPYAPLNWHITPIPGWKQLTLIDSSTEILRAIESGLGIGPLSHAAAATSRVPLVPVLPEILSQSIDIYYMFPKILSNSKVITELYTYLRERPEGALKGRLRR